ncbi:hypothetical protein HMPREF0044_1329 [Gleimia coleocanis DSM 15436]|uniref:Uncharacterized protein n=1 Tax=Gleimia coleocanis DSM 15436 TaxID=525245 RepID=C0W1N9_9ACTO|nr:hypothetical protein HMPREF0044_1329 [Gleimia coleocanis DSM 15436]
MIKLRISSGLMCGPLMQKAEWQVCVVLGERSVLFAVPLLKWKP